MMKTIFGSTAGQPAKSLQPENASFRESGAPPSAACRSNLGLAADELDAHLTSAQFLPLPPVARRLLELCTSRTTTAADIAHSMEDDPVFATRLIRLANVVRDGGGIPVTNIQAAAVRLGTDRIKSIALGFQTAYLASSLMGNWLDAEAFWRTALARACVARVLALRCHRRVVGEAFLIGLLQDLGSLVLAEHAPDIYADLWRQSEGCQMRLAKLELQAYEMNHIRAAQRLFKKWQMPALLSDTVGRHHSRPPAHATPDPAIALWQIAYFVGALPIGPPRPSTFYDRSLGDILEETFGIASADQVRVFEQAESEVRDLQEMFRPLIGGITGPSGSFAQIIELVGQAAHVRAVGPRPASSLRRAEQPLSTAAWSPPPAVRGDALSGRASSSRANVASSR